MNMTAYITACAIVNDVYVIGDKETFNELVYQVKKIGSNINQLRMLSQLGRIECVDLKECTYELDNHTQSSQHNHTKGKQMATINFLKRKDSKNSGGSRKCDCILYSTIQN